MVSVALERDKLIIVEALAEFAEHGYTIVIDRERVAKGELPEGRPSSAVAAATAVTR